LLVLLPWLSPSQRLRLTLLFFMELMDMLVLDMSDILMLVMVMAMLDIPLLLLDMLQSAPPLAPALLVLPLLLSLL